MSKFVVMASDGNEKWPLIHFSRDPHFKGAHLVEKSKGEFATQSRWPTYEAAEAFLQHRLEEGSDFELSIEEVDE